MEHKELVRPIITYSFDAARRFRLSPSCHVLSITALLYKNVWHLVTGIESCEVMHPGFISHIFRHTLVLI